MARSDKEKRVDELADRLMRAKGVVLSDFTGLNVEQMTDLRRRCRENSVEYLVVKNSLARFAASKADLEPLLSYLKGPNGFTFGYDDAIAPARVINDFARESQSLTIKAGIFEGGIIGPDQVKRIAVLPGREVLLSQLLMQMGAPISRFAGALRSMLTQFLYVLTQIRETKAEKPVAESEESAQSPGEQEASNDEKNDELKEKRV